jgi:uracil-DNA glycosylase
VAVATDDISDRYLRKAIAEINELGADLARASGERAPVLGSGHPLADVFLLKYGPQASEIHEGVAFFGRTGQAILKSIQRLRVDPTAIYGTNCLKFEDEDPGEARAYVLRELHIVQPKLVVVMGHDARQFLNELEFPLSTEVADCEGTIQRFTPTIDALVTPDVDACLDEQEAKRAFWDAFKALGPWWSELPPY